LPTQLLERFDEFCGQPIVKVSELERLVADLPAPDAPATNAGRSTSETLLNEEQLAIVPDVLAEYKSLSYYCMAMRQANPAGRRKVTALDFQIAFLVLSACRLKPNANGQLPGNRIKAIWTYLFENGFVTRGFDGSRWKVIRDTMEDCGFLNMVDNTYYFNLDGVKGKAMEWSLKGEYAHDFERHTHIYCGTLPEYVECRSRPLLVFRPRFDFEAADEALEALFATTAKWQGGAWPSGTWG
jgi:hypothetical protein